MQTEWMTFLLAMTPVLELRAAIPYGIANGLPPFAAFATAVAGNLVPVPFIILCFRMIIRWLKALRFLRPLVEKVEKRVEEKSGVVLRYASLGLLFLVAVPLPGTGAWTGAMVSALVDLRMKRSLPIIVLGVIIAGLLVTGLSCGVIHIVG